MHPFVSSLGAFWPGMQALAGGSPLVPPYFYPSLLMNPRLNLGSLSDVGQEREAVELHANYTAAWRAFGWMPEVFHLDLSKVRLRPTDWALVSPSAPPPSEPVHPSVPTPFAIPLSLQA